MTDKSNSTAPRLMRLPEVMKRCCLSRSTIYTQIERGEFPKPLKLGDRAVAWVEQEIDQWINNLISARRD